MEESEKCRKRESFSWGISVPKKGIEKSQDALSRPRNMADEGNFTNILNIKQLNECHFLKEVKF